jgi:hypothetical protein
MSRNLFVGWLCLASMPAFAGDLTVVLKPDSSYSQEALATMEKEAASIYRPAGVQLKWRLASELAEAENFQDVVVVTLHGRCDSDGLLTTPQSSDRNKALGTTHISDRHILPFATIECDSVRRYVRPRAATLRQTEWDSLLGRALGRVVAHELYHILSGSTKHGQQGVAKASHSQEDLDHARFELSQADIRFLGDSAGKP